MPINIEDEPDCGSDADVMSDDGPYIPGIPSTEPSSVVTLETNATTKRKRRSVVWDEFTIIDGQGFDDGKNRAECKRCKQVYRADKEVSRGLNFMKPMAVEMKKKFDKYWSEYSPILAIALVFDPRYKLSFVTWAFSKLCNLDLNASTMCHNVRNSLYQLFDEYKSMQPSDYDVPTLTHRPGRSRTRFEFMVSELAEMDNGNKSQLDIYLDEPKVPFNDNEYDEYDVLAFWKANGSRYPDVARMARDVLAILVSTVASESAFSAGGRVIDKYRSKLLPTNAEALICLRDWMFDIDFRAEPFDDPTDVDNALGNILELLHIENERGAVASSSAGPTPREG
ncbi:zinc finger BED domain-containing protein DAYSLEEPER-like [Macadamia integrifolia]|uniref:zinc finger BED domain-containing protein DAYSLEEPER-like n=1 Tax=Macadamia integrifolia TaxID=60698 RepID=UPI001C4E3934|nr:zinc finger BED domain-containing protein DAYSLEEPER-like [Macadamia integrifolia]